MQSGPTVKLELSCFDCQHCKSSRYTCQGDSGSDVFCGAMNNRTIGDTTWKTPEWCPFRAAAIREMVSQPPKEPCKTYDELCSFLMQHGLSDRLKGKEEYAREWRACRISDGAFIAALTFTVQPDEGEEIRAGDGVSRICKAIGVTSNGVDAVVCQLPHGHTGKHQNGLEEWDDPDFDAVSPQTGQAANAAHRLIESDLPRTAGNFTGEDDVEPT